MKNQAAQTNRSAFARGTGLIYSDLPLIWLLLGCAALYCWYHSAFTRSDPRRAEIHVPAMSDTRTIRIVTNAALDEVVARYDGTQNDYEVDLPKKLVLYHENQRLLSPEYQRRIEARIGDVGFTARVAGARFNPPLPLPTSKGPVQTWPDRCSAVISVPTMVSNTDANTVVNAIAYARLGHEDPRVAVKGTSRRIVVRYEGLHLALKNIEYAIACVGFDANGVPARFGRRDAIPYGWTPVRL